MTDLQTAYEQGRDAAQRCLELAERNGFDSSGARRFIVSWVRRHGPTSGEDLVLAAQSHGYRAKDGRAFGGVFKAALNAKELRVLRSDLPRKHGHGTSGGRLYGAVSIAPPHCGDGESSRVCTVAHAGHL